MNRVKVKAFGITRDILGAKETEIELPMGKTVGDLRAELSGKYPQLLGIRSLFIAVNNQYAEDQREIMEHDEIAIIPPVSGG